MQNDHVQIVEYDELNSFWKINSDFENEKVSRSLLSRYFSFKLSRKADNFIIAACKNNTSNFTILMSSFNI